MVVVEQIAESFLDKEKKKNVLLFDDWSAD